MSTEYHQIPSQQGLLSSQGYVSVETDADQWLASSTNKLKLSSAAYELRNSSKLQQEVPSLFDNEEPMSWNVMLNPAALNKSTGVRSPAMIPKQFIPTSSKIDAWSVVDPAALDSIKQPKNQDLSTAEEEEKVTIEEELASQNRYKTELCKSFNETGICRYGTKCQFAHGKEELRPILRHPKYKTEICKTFHSTGTCPYGIRCRFIHTKSKEEVAIIQAALAKGNLSELFAKGQIMETAAIAHLLHAGKVAPPPGIPAVAQTWSKDWAPPASLGSQRKAIKKPSRSSIDFGNSVEIF